MSSKMNYIPHISSYEDIRAEMSNDLQYRLASRTAKTSLGRPLYYRINVQMITTQECPFHCPFCLERQNPMSGDNDFDAQIEALKRVLQEHPNARLSITGGEPGLYPKHIANIVETYRKHGNGVFCSINTTGFSTELNGLAHINLSRNDYVWTDPAGFPGCTVQTVVENPTLAFIKDYMKMDASSFSFRFLSGLEKKDYPVDMVMVTPTLSSIQMGVCLPTGDKGRALMDTDGLLLPVILSALMTMTSLMLTQQSLTSSLNLSQGRPSHDGFGFYKSALFAGLSGR